MLRRLVSLASAALPSAQALSPGQSSAVGALLTAAAVAPTGLRAIARFSSLGGPGSGGQGLSDLLPALPEFESRGQCGVIVGRSLFADVRLVSFVLTDTPHEGSFGGPDGAAGRRRRRRRRQTRRFSL